MTDATATAVLAAGALCWRMVGDSPRILIVKRTQHKDISLPKGKVDPGETLPETAVREIAEETGLSVGLGAPLGEVRYKLPNGRNKIVYYWAIEVDDHTRKATTFKPNGEIAALEWLSIADARKQLTYPHDVEIVDTFAARLTAGMARTFAITVVRHGKAVPPDSWDGPDHTRPLMQRGVDQAASIAHGLAAFRPAKIVTSTAVRCVATIAPLARISAAPVKETDSISQEAHENGTGNVAKEVRKRLKRKQNVVLCSHGPVIPEIISRIMTATNTATSPELRHAASLSTAEYVVMHVSVDHPEAGLVAVETHSPTAE